MQGDFRAERNDGRRNRRRIKDDSPLKLLLKVSKRLAVDVLGFLRGDVLGILLKVSLFLGFGNFFVKRVFLLI